MSFQVCVCGWSKVTSYHGLRTHQGKMGCTQRGVRIPERNAMTFMPQITFKQSPIYLNQPERNFFTWSVNNLKRENTEEESRETTERSSLGLRSLRLQSTILNMFAQTSSMEHPINLNEPNKPVMTSTESVFQTPEPPPRHQTATNTYRPRRALEFSTGADQTTPPTTAVHPREEEEEEQRKTEKLLMKAQQDNKRAELQQIIQIRKLKMAEVELSVKGLKVRLDTEWMEINNVFSEVKKVVEDARQRALQPVEERRQRVKREGKDLLQRLKRETEELEKTIAELDRNSDLQISLDEPGDWNKTSVDTLERGLRSPLPMIVLSNVHSLRNKMKELRHLITTKDFALSSVLCFTESWLTEATPDSAVELTDFQLLRADRDPILSRKKNGGGICFYINHGWCSDVEVILKSCSPDLETLFITCRPFYSPREFTSFILAGVYIPSKANVREAQRELAEQIQRVKRRREHKSSTVIVLGDFNKANLSHKLPEYKQLVKCPTRGEKTLDHCYSTISKAYHAVSHPALGRSDHVLIHLIPAYRQKLNISKPDVLRCQNWSSREAMEELRDCLENTHWDNCLDLKF
ncbi:uncharacterized protein LOC128430166 isoform X2 [Pleuronectes platessa]|uniref:uncharacterized protein LOC128430166 isoform X2 n=1 Tax=Pleuronectes platessa TaxID=8262 RepID=UPI00232A4A1D|nr:uncharacterized protein LOC128430166 isoform X2 [Pleuronectes platessa]